MKKKTKIKLTLKEATDLARKFGWRHWLGYTKKELGVITPKAPRRMKCGCEIANQNNGKGWYFTHYCQRHNYIHRNI
jgi:hypothetical protein